MAAKSARRRASTGLFAAASGTSADAGLVTSALERRATTLHAATGIAAASATTVRMALVLSVGLRPSLMMMCLNMAFQAAARSARVCNRCARVDSVKIRPSNRGFRAECHKVDRVRVTSLIVRRQIGVERKGGEGLGRGGAKLNRMDAKKLGTLLAVIVSFQTTS